MGLRPNPAPLSGFFEPASRPSGGSRGLEVLMHRFLSRSVFGPALVLAATGMGCGGAGEDDTGSGAGAQSVGAERPPQFVLLAFDGSLNNDFWTESRGFAKAANVKFTYFISGVYFIPDAQRKLYDAPHGFGPGKSAIGFGGAASDIAVRYKNV